MPSFHSAIRTIAARCRRLRHSSPTSTIDSPKSSATSTVVSIRSAGDRYSFFRARSQCEFLFIAFLFRLWVSPAPSICRYWKYRWNGVNSDFSHHRREQHTEETASPAFFRGLVLVPAPPLFLLLESADMVGVRLTPRFLCVGAGVGTLLERTILSWPRTVQTEQRGRRGRRSPTTFYSSKVLREAARY